MVNTGPYHKLSILTNLLAGGMHNLIIHTSVYPPEARFRRVRRKNITGVICVDSIDFSIENGRNLPTRDLITRSVFRILTGAIIGVLE